MTDWYRKSTWRNLVDMHIPDWNDSFLSRFSPEEYIGALSDAGVDTAILYAGNCLGMCFWPTAVGHMHAGLKGRNINRETFDLARQKGMNVVMYFNIWNRWAYDTHPEWRMVTLDGRTTMENREHVPVSRFGQVCINHEGYRQFVYDQIRSICEQFDADGLWIDMIGYFGTVCCCPACRSKYLRETGRELPTVVDWNHPDWVSLVRKREEWLTDFANGIRSLARSIRPGLSLAFQSASLMRGWDGGIQDGFLRASDYLAGDFYGDAVQYSVTCKYLNNLTENRPMEFMTSRCQDLADHTSTKSIDELRSSAMGAFMHNAAFVFIDAIDPMGTMNRDFYRKMGALHEELRPFEQAVSIDAALVSDLAIYQNLASQYVPSDNGRRIDQELTPVRAMQRMANWGKTMIRGQIAYDLIGERQLGSLPRCPMILLPQSYVLSPSETEAFSAYVREGGILLMTGESGLNTADGARRNDFALADLFGVHYAGLTDEDITYMAPTAEGQPFFSGFTAQYPLTIHGPMVKVHAGADVTVLSTVTLPYSRTDEVYRFGSAISNPPGKASSLPAITLRRAGKGLAVYLAAPLEDEKLPNQRRLLTDLVKWLRPERRIRAEIPDWLEAIAFEDRENHCWQLNLMNTLQEANGLIARDLRFTLRFPERAQAITEVGSARTFPFEQDDEVLRFTVDEICDYSMLRIHY